MNSPEANFGKYFRFCSSDPKEKIGYITNEDCTDAAERTAESPRSNSCMINPYDI